MLVFLSGCGRENRVTTTSQEALRYYTDGVSQWEKFYYREAKALFEQALAADSMFSMAWVRLAMVDGATQNEAEALTDIEKAVHYGAHVSRREQLFIRMWYSRLHYFNDAAAAAADSLASLYPDEKEAYLFRGNMYEMGKNFDAAIRSYQKAIAIDSTYALAVMWLGYAYSTSGDQEKAIEQMKRYIRLAPGAADPRASYADLLVRAGRYDEALEQYRKSLELKPDYWYSVREIGNVYATLGRLREAEEQFHRSFKLLPQGAQLEALHLAADGTLNYLRGKYEDAVGEYTNALRIDSTLGIAAYGLVQSYSKLRQFQGAEYVMDRMWKEFERRNLLQTPSMLALYVLKARVRIAQDSLKAARASCDSALQFTSPLNRSAVYREYAEISLREKNFEAALDACEEALTVNPNSPEVLLTLTKVYHAKGDVQMTVEIGGRLLALWREADPDYQNLLEVRRILGRQQGSSTSPGHGI